MNTIEAPQVEEKKKPEAPHYGPPAKADNCSLLSNLIESYGITIPNKEFDQWRPVSKAGGYISEWTGMVFVLCTDGNIGWFVTQSGTIFQAHLANFSGPVNFWYVDYVDGWDHDNRKPKPGFEHLVRESGIMTKREKQVQELLDWLLS